MKKYRTRVLVALACALMATSGSWAQMGGTQFAITKTVDMAFGKFAAGSGGTITVNPAGGRTKTGGVVLVSSGAGAAAQFTVTGSDNQNYAITLPGVVSLTSGTTNTNSMAVNTFTSNPSGTGRLSAAGSQTLFVGATLTVGSNQATGIYSGSFNVEVVNN